MNDNAFKHSDDNSSILQPPRAFDMIVYGGLVVGILDGLFALIYYGQVLGVPTMRIFQSVASGLLGQAAFEGGLGTFLIGIGLHFIVAACLAAVYYGVSLKLPILIHKPVLSGLAYGALSYLGMNYVVIPLSAIGLRKFSLPVFLTAIIGHALLVGLPLGLLAEWSAKANQQSKAV
jgi:hypothetical protein